MTVPTLPFAITVCGIEELAGHIDTRASHVLSILDPLTPLPEAFGRYGEHERLELRFDDVVDETPDLRPPTRDDVAALLAFGRDLIGEARPGAHLLVHCHAGISRSTAAMSLILAQALPQLPASAVLAQVHEIREKAWPNLRMMEFGDAMLQRNGTLIAATHALHALQLTRRPQLVELMEGFGRRREIIAAQAMIAEKA